jgi:hypothetical protein
MRRLALALALFAASAGCSRNLPTPFIGPHRGEQPIAVPYPPPPARVEIIPDRPASPKGTVWIDGEWSFQAHRWVWIPGRWQLPVIGAYYAPGTTARLADGTLAWFPATWHRFDE